MSWAFLHISKLNGNEDYSEIHDEPLYKYSDDKIYIAAGGNAKTCIAGIDNNSKRGFVVLGIGISVDKPEFLNTDSWDSIINNFNPSKIDGHFVIIKWDEKQIDVYTDVLGLRDIYLYRTADDIYLSTNPLMLKSFKTLEIDFPVFGSRWLLFNQISSRSIFKGIERISGGTKLNINRNDLTIGKTNIDFVPETDSKNNIDEFDEKLEQLILFTLNQNNKLSLSLSGGMDSRVLLSFLLDNKDRDWSVHTFGSKNNPDRIISERLVADYKIPHEFVNIEINTQDEIIEYLKEYLSYTFACNPASEIIQLMNYSAIQNKYDILIDGGFGEIWRRQFLNRLFFLGKKSIKNKNTNEISKFIRLPKADIFSDETKDLMVQGVLQQIEEIFDEMPAVSEIGIANWLDMFAIRTRLTNLYSPEQIRLDQKHFCFMPFAQLSLLRLLFSIDVAQRKNSRLFRKLINKHQAGLSKYPLAKNSFTYSFNSSPVRLALTAKLNQIFGMKTHDNSKYTFFKTISEFTLDTINSKSVRENPNYDYNKIQKMAEQFKKYPTEYQRELDWFLSFEVMRTIIT